MFNFNAFWNQLGVLPKENTFDKYFDEECTLETLLDDDQIIGEFRNQNQKLMNFMQIEQMQTLVHYITKMPEADAPANVQFRYPFYSCELLCCEIPKLQMFFQSPQLLDQLFKVLNLSTMNPVLAGYFMKVFMNLYKLNSEGILFYVFANHVALTKLLLHVQSKSVCDVISRILCIEQCSEGYLESRIFIINDLLFKLQAEEDFEVAGNIFMIFHDLITKAYGVKQAESLFERILSQTFFEKLIMLTINENHYISQAAISIVYSLLHLVYQDDLRADTEGLKLNYDAALFTLEINIPLYIQYLNLPTPQLGLTKLKIVESIAMALRLESDILPQTLAINNLFGTLNRILLKYPNNNLFHLAYLRILQIIVESMIPSLVINVFQTNQLIPFLLECSRNKKGYAGFIAKIAKFLEDVAQKNAEIAKYLEHEDWATFQIEFYGEQKTLQQMELGGFKKEEKIEEECTFNREEIKDKYQEFLCFDAFSQFQSAPQQTEPQAAFDAFGFDFSSTSSQEGQSWDSQPPLNQVENIPQLEIQEEANYWKIIHDKDVNIIQCQLEAKALAEFDQNF